MAFLLFGSMPMRELELNRRNIELRSKTQGLMSDKSKKRVKNAIEVKYEKIHMSLLWV